MQVSFASIQNLRRVLLLKSNYHSAGSFQLPCIYSRDLALHACKTLYTGDWLCMHAILLSWPTWANEAVGVDPSLGIVALVSSVPGLRVRGECVL